MRSHLLVGTVRHRRSRPVVYELEHAVYYAALDLDELDEVARRSRLIGRNRWNVLSFRDRDHLVPPADDVRAAAFGHLRGEGFDPSDWRITLITNLRVLGYEFNPASFFLCRDAEGELRVVLVEVHNTHGERRVYTLRPRRKGGAWVDSMDKDFYVSPFIDMDARYTVYVRDDGPAVRIAISETEGGAHVLTAAVVLHRRPLTDRVLVGLLVRMPLVTHKTIAAIHLHAWRLWRRGVRFHRHPEVAP
jgi:DUF1365 family protein